jgi:PIN domain nuclease of toxin-antitoxin system
MIFLDTNVVIWLYQKNLELFTPKTLGIIEREDLYISPLVQLELQYLFEIGRGKVKPAKVLSDLHAEIGVTIHNVGLSTLIDSAIDEDWTRDPFDRLIVAHAKLQKAKLITKDATILKRFPGAVWS